MFIGKKIKDLRLTHRMSLSELAEKSGVQIATLSRIEHLKMTGTLASHMSIAKALGVDITELYTDIVNKEDRVTAMNSNTVTDVFTYNTKSSYDILTTNLFSKKMMPILLKIEPEGETSKEKSLGGTEKFIYILSGSIKAIINGEPFPLSRNNTLYFDASVEHYFVNSGKSTAKIICVITPVNL